MPGEIASAYVSLIPSFRGGTSKISSELGGPTTQAAKANGKLFGQVFSGTAAGYMASNLALNGVQKAFSFAKSGVVDFNSELQQSKIAFTTMLGSGRRAEVFLNRLQAFAKATPFEFSGLVKNSQLLLGMGISAKDLIPTMTALGDSAASVGASQDVLNNTMLAFGQIAAKGKLSMDNMNQLLEGGVPTALKVLAAQFHTTTGEMVNMISKGQVQSSVALPLLVKGLEKGTKATKALGGMMDKQSHTYAGAMSNIGDSTQQALGKIGKPLFDQLSVSAQRLATYLSSPKFNRFANTARKDIANGLRIANTAVAGFISGMREGTGVGGAFADTLHLAGGGLKLVYRVGKGVVGVFNDMPGPMKSIVVEGALIALIWPKIASGAASMGTAVTSRLVAVKAEMVSLRTEGTLTSAGMTKLSSAAKGAAGIGGLLALTQASQTTNKNLGLMEKAAGGAALGFSVAGPWGAAVGGAVGAISGLASKMHEANRSTREFSGALSRNAAIRAYTKDTRDLRDSLNQVTGAFTRSTNAGIRDKLVKSGQLPMLNKMGISTRALILAIKGNKDALDAVAPGFNKLSKRIANAQTEANRLKGILAAVQAKGANTAAGNQELKNQGFAGSFDDLVKQYQAILNVKNGLVAAKAVLPGFTQDLKNNQAAIRKNTLDTRDYHKVLKAAGFGRTLIGKIQVHGIPQSTRGIAGVIRQFKLARNNSTITALIKASGWEVTTKRIRGVNTALQTASKTSKKTAGDAGKGSGENYLQKLVANLLGGQPKTTNSMKTLLSGAGNASSRTAASVGKGSGLVMTNNLAAEIRSGRSSVVSAWQYLLNSARNSGPSGGGGGGGSSSTPHGASRAAVTVQQSSRTAGRTLSSPQRTTTTSGTPVLPDTLRLVLADGTELDAYLEDIADGSVSSRQELVDSSGRAL